MTCRTRFPDEWQADAVGHSSWRKAPPLLLQGGRGAHGLQQALCMAASRCVRQAAAAVAVGYGWRNQPAHARACSDCRPDTNHVCVGGGRPCIPYLPARRPPGLRRAGAACWPSSLSQRPRPGSRSGRAPAGRHWAIGVGPSGKQLAAPGTHRARPHRHRRVAADLQCHAMRRRQAAAAWVGWAGALNLSPLQGARRH